MWAAFKRQFTPSEAVYSSSTGDLLLTIGTHNLQAATTHTVENASYVASVTESNVLLNINKITQQSQLLKERIENGQLAICGGVYQIKDGTINWI